MSNAGLPNKFYDVVIVGAGPAGSYAAYKLASLGYSVAVLERKSAPGIDVCCTGIISIECFDSLDISQDLVLTRANSARFFSPSGRCLKLQSDKAQACVIDRALLDQTMACRAQASGASYYFSSHVTGIATGNDMAQVEARCSGAKVMFMARAVILASGFSPGLTWRLGLGKIKHWFIGAQAEIEARGISEIEVYFNQQISPGFFAWLVPISANKALAGLATASQAKIHLQKFLHSSFCQGRIVNHETKIKQKLIPIGTLPRTYGDRVLVIGDAAGQVKPTTGGGVYLGHLGAGIAVEVLDGALSSDNLLAGNLSCYQKQWKIKLGKEISLGYKVRRAYAKLSDRQIERIFNMMDSWGIARALLDSPGFSFDWHSTLVLAGLKYSLAYPLRKVWHLSPGGHGL